MLPTCYLELIMLVYHCLRLDNWHTVIEVVNLRMFLASLVCKEQFYIWCLGGILCGRFGKMVFLRYCVVCRKIWP